MQPEHKVTGEFMVLVTNSIKSLLNSMKDITPLTALLSNMK